MRLFSRLLLSNLLVILLAVTGMFIAADVLAPTFYKGHVQHMAEMMGMMGGSVMDTRQELERGLHTTLVRALLVALPIGGTLALLTAWLISRNLGRSVQRLDEGSRALVQGDYARRLPETGQDELTDLAHNFNMLAGALEKVEQGRIELIGNVAHELRAPLAALRGYADAMQDGIMTPEHAAQAISREVGAMDRLVRDLSLVSKVEAGEVELHLKTLQPRKLLETARERFELLFEDKGVQLQITQVNFLVVQADEERTLQVLTNLLGNALKHTPTGGKVKVDALPEGAFLRFSVTDTGSGIPSEHLPRIFERFYRADPARSRGEAGSGVGLTISKGLVEAMGGEMRVESLPGVGSTLSFTLPLSSA